MLNKVRRLSQEIEKDIKQLKISKEKSIKNISKK